RSAADLRVQGLSGVTDEVTQVGSKSVRRKPTPVDIAVGVYHVPRVPKATAVLAQTDATRVAEDDGHVVRVVRATHGGRWEVTLYRLHGELHAIGRSQPGPELTRSHAYLRASAGVEGRRERLDVEPVDRNRLRSSARIGAHAARGVVSV